MSYFVKIKSYPPKTAQSDACLTARRHVPLALRQKAVPLIICGEVQLLLGRDVTPVSVQACDEHEFGPRACASLASGSAP